MCIAYGIIGIFYFYFMYKKTKEIKNCHLELLIDLW